jgi:hypothetical protein
VQGRYPGDCSEPAVATNIVYAFGTPELAELRAPGKVAAPAAELSPCIPFVRFACCHDPGVLLRSDHVEEAEYTGNEAIAAEDDTVYFSAALIVAPQV